MIGKAREKMDCFTFKDGHLLEGQARTVNLSPQSSLVKIMLWHHILGHSNFHYLQKLFLLLFKGNNPCFFQCEICMLSKHQLSTFSLQPYTKPAPFVHEYLISLAKCYTQTMELTTKKTFAPEAKLHTVRILLPFNQQRIVTSLTRSKKCIS